MFSETVALIGVILLASIVSRGFCGQMIRKYPFFYVQMGLALLIDVPCYVSYVIRPKLYYEMYWTVQFITMFAACGIILEILNHVFSPYAVLQNFVKVMRFILGFVIVGSGAAYLALADIWRVEVAKVNFERDFRAVQAVLLLLILGVAFYYGLPIGKNLKGMFVGYGLYVGASLLVLSIESYVGVRFAATWYFLQPLAYVTSLAIWLATLWTDHPNPVVWMGNKMASNGESLAARTRLTMSATRSYVSGAVSA